MEDQKKSALEITRIRFAFWLAVLGLGLSAGLVVFLYLSGMTDSNDIIAVVGIFTGVTGTLVGTFFGVQVGSMGREQEREERRNAERMANWAMGKLDPAAAGELMEALGNPWG